MIAIEAPTFVSEEAVNFRRDFSEITRIRNLSRAAGVESKTVKLNYDPVLARAKFERLRQTNPTEQKMVRFREHELREIDTALRERYHAAKSTTVYIIGEDQEIYNELFSHEPFKVVLQRGLAYQKENNSKELEREQSEYEGWEEICNKLKDPSTPLHTKAVVISGPGLVEETNYTDNFVDAYEVLEDPHTHKRYIKMVRHASQMKYREYWDKVLLLEPNYFQGLNGPIDAWFLKNPLFRSPERDSRTVDELFEQVFERRKDATPENIMQQVLKDSIRVKSYYIDQLCQNVFNPREVAFAWNAILVNSDNAKKRLAQGYNLDTNFTNSAFRNIREEVRWLGVQRIQTILGGCGPSAGLTINGIEDTNPINLHLSNSVGKFGLFTGGEDGHGSLTFTHDECEAKSPGAGKNVRPKGKLLTHYQCCGKEIKKC